MHAQQFKLYHFYIFIFLASCFNSLCFSQNITNEKIDSLSYLDYDTINKHIDFNDTIKTKILVTAYLNKGKRELDTIRQARAFRVLFLLNKNKTIENNSYADSIIYLTKNLKHKDYPRLGYFFKAVQLYGHGDYKNSLDYFLKVKNSSKDSRPDTERYIGFIKTRLGYYDEAFVAYKEALKLYKKINHTKGILETYYALGDVTRFLKQTDSSLHYSNLGYKLATEKSIKVQQAYFLFNKGATLSDIGEYEDSQHNLTKALPGIIKVNDKANTAICHFFIGRNYSKLNNSDKALYHLKKMDSIFLETKNLNPELREGYKILIEHYKQTKNIKNQLVYVERMLLVDSILNKSYNYIDKALLTDYSRIKLKKEQQRLNKEIVAVKKSSSIKIITGIIIIFLLSILLLIKSIKHKKDILKFEAVINNQPQKDTSSIVINETEKKIKKKPILKLNEDIELELIIKLDEFEKNKDFLNSDLTRENLSKKLNTNVKYLSKIINQHKNKTFINYINDLRIDYAIEQLLDENSNFIKWSVKAIAKEVGFNYTEPFSRAFFKKTGIKPSFFIKNLRKKHTEFVNSDL